MRSPALIYLITRTHGLSTHLIPQDTIESMVKAPTYESFIEALLRTDYSEYISTMSREELTVNNLERIFASVYSNRVYYPIRFTGGSIKKLMISYARRIEVENIKRILRAKFSGAKITSDMLIPIPREYQEINFAAMAEAPTIEAAVDFVTVSIYKEAYQYLTVSKEANSVIPLELYVENEYYGNLIKSCKGVPNVKDVLSAVLAESDVKNIYYVIGLKILELTPETLSSAFSTIKAGRIKEFLEEFLRLKVDMIVDRLEAIYDWVIKNIHDAVMRRDLNAVRVGCSRALKEYYDRIRTAKPLNLVYVLAYLFSVESEYFNLRAILHGKHLGIKDEEIKKLLV